MIQIEGLHRMLDILVIVDCGAYSDRARSITTFCLDRIALPGLFLSLPLNRRDAGL